MYSISNKQYSEIMMLLRAFIQRPVNGGEIHSQNARRKALLLMRNLQKRKRYDKVTTHK